MLLKEEWSWLIFIWNWARRRSSPVHWSGLVGAVPARLRLRLYRRLSTLPHATGGSRNGPSWISSLAILSSSNVCPAIQPPILEPPLSSQTPTPGRSIQLQPSAAWHYFVH